MLNALFANYTRRDYVGFEDVLVCLYESREILNFISTMIDPSNCGSKWTQTVRVL